MTSNLTVDQDKFLFGFTRAGHFVHELTPEHASCKCKFIYRMNLFYFLTVTSGLSLTVHKSLQSNNHSWKTKIIMI